MRCDGRWRLGRLALPLMLTGCAVAQTPAPAGASGASAPKQDTAGLYRVIGHHQVRDTVPVHVLDGHAS